MKPAHKKYMLENISKKSVSEISRELGLKERKVKKFLDKENIKIKKEISRVSLTTTSTDFEEKISEKKEYSRLSELLIFSCIMLVALLVRLIYLNQIKTSPFFVPFYHGLDDYLYDSWAQSIASGNVIGKEIFYGLPLYPYFLGLVYFIFGHSVFIAKSVQLFIGSISCGLIYLIGRRIFNRPVGIIASLIMVFYSMAIFFEGFFVSAFLAIFLNSLIVLLLISCEERPSFFKWISAGFLIGLSSLANASILIFLFFLIFWIIKTFKDRLMAKRMVYLALLFAGTLLTIMPVTVRNYLIGKDFVPVTAHSGITFYAGNNPLSDGSFKLPRSIGTSVIDSKKNAAVIAERITGKKLKPSEISNFWFNQGVMFMKNEPFSYARLILIKSILFWNAHEIPDVLPMAFFKKYSSLLKLPMFNYAIVLPFAIFGMLLCAKYKKKDVLLIYLFVFSVFTSTTIYFVNTRYRLIAVPYLGIFAAAAFYWFYERIREKKLKLLIPSAGLVIILFILTQVRILDFGMAQAHNSLGIILKRKGLYNEAIGEYTQAIELARNYDSPYFNLGLLYFERGNYKKAIDSFNGALKINPEFIKAHNYIGRTYMKIGKREKALYHWKKSLEFDPNQPEIRSLLGK